uniref:zinc finger protein 653 isoform X2 n=1 Tax=Monopterus albus TaxID=43700 RepID=UPI0009B35F9C|nr:zinc finger protein 653 isoform X2 [Monopterus albus]
MAQVWSEMEVPLDADQAEDRGKGVSRRCRGRPRLTDSDRAQRRLESRKKYDVRRVYLGESHRLWSELRRRTSLTDAGLAEYLILLHSTYGEKYQQKYCGKKVYPEVSVKLKKDVGENVDVSEVQHTTMSVVEQAADPNPQPGVDVSSRDDQLTAQPVWEMEVVMKQQDSPGTAFHSIPSEEEAEDLRGGREECEGLGEEEEIRALPHRYECATSVMTSLAEKLEKTEDDSVLSQSLSDSVPPAVQVQEQSELFDPQTLQTVVTSCEIPDQRMSLEGSQLIIITGPSYEALASDGIQLNMGSGNVEEVTCTVIGGVTYNQVCPSDSKIRAAEEEDSMTGLSDKQLLQPAVDSLELSSDPELQRGLSSVRSKRNRRGPVIEADGMLKMFHCPYEGCSQVYVAISSFQNHVNLVHRKGRTKVCPHPGCGKKFYLSNHLHRHMIIHSGVRDFICETCGKSFKRKNHLEVHRRTHTGETPLQCEICGYQCRQRASLNWHMRKHTPEAHYNFTCDFCDKRFEKLDSVKFHKLKSHPDKQAT